MDLVKMLLYVDGDACMEQRESAPQLPIEYWLRRADEVVTVHVNQVLEDYGFTRSRWLVFNRIYEAGTILKEDICETMKIFTTWLDEILDGFIQKGWLVKWGDGDMAVLTLTESGKCEYEAITALQGEVRSRMLNGISDQEYTAVVEVLQRMVSNLTEVSSLSEYR
jgi:DNA-binding MarR family transcriptional regulator